MKKKVFKIILAVVILFATYNIIWFAWSHIKYGKLSDGMKEEAYANSLYVLGAYDSDRLVGIIRAVGNGRNNRVFAGYHRSAGLPEKRDRNKAAESRYGKV